MFKTDWLFKKDEITREVVEKVENELNISFPEFYAKCILKNHGAQPEENMFDFEEREGAVFGSLLHFNLNEKNNILEVYDDVKDRLPDLVYPFAEDPAGNLICFDYRENEEPDVVFWDHEQAQLEDEDAAISYICDSFEELLDQLYDVEL